MENVLAIQALKLCSYHIYQKYSERQVFAKNVNADQEQSDQLCVSHFIAPWLLLTS